MAVPSRRLDLRLRAGEVLGIYGFMGCGQIELARALFGKIKPEGGALRSTARPPAPAQHG
jgi:ribose transport system ATP-binding protein